MARTFDFFKTNADFKEVVPGIESSTTLKSMQASHQRSKQKIAKIITPVIYEELRVVYVADDPDAKQAIAIDFLQGSHGNQIAYFEIVSKILRKKKEDVAYYKYEIQMQQENYLDAFAINMDELLDYMDANSGSFTDWTGSDTYKLRQNLILKSADDFNKKLPTGGSAYFFNLITPLQNKVIQSEIVPRMKLDAIDPKVQQSLEYFVAYRTMADATCLVDYADFPRSMRQKLFIDESKKKGKEMENMNKYYCDKFNAEADKYLQQIDICLQTADTDTEISVPECGFNLESDKTYVIS